MIKSYHQTIGTMTNNLRKFFERAGFRKAVVGISGGIDSALVVCIAVLTLGRENVIGVTMPGAFTSEETKADALEIIKRLGIRGFTLPIADVVAEFHEAMDSAKPSPRKLGTKADENLLARVRGTMLMWVANEYDALVLATGNKTEAMMGYCTLYGDTVGAVEVIGNLYKRDVYDLARFINDCGTMGGKVIPESVFTRPPSAEIKPGQTDEADLGITYDELDSILERIEAAQFKRDLCSPNLPIEEE